MADIVFNISKGRVAELCNRVNNNDPTNALLEISVLDNTTQTDAVIRDVNDLGAVYALSGAGEPTNTNYSRFELTSTGGIQVLTDDTADVNDVDLPDQTWSSVGATTAGGFDWTDLIMSYSTLGAADGVIVPMTMHDFAVTPDGSDITAQFNAEGFFRAS